MGSSANITSVAEINHFRIALKNFEEGASSALTSVMIQIRRTVDWVEREQLPYWQMRVKRSYDEIAETRTTLERCQMFALDDERRGCDEEKKAFEKAKRHLRHAQEKVDVVKKWARALSHDVSEYQASAGLLAGWLEGECPKALASLERMMTSLEAYLATEVAVTSEPSTAVTSEPSTAVAPEPTTAVTPEPTSAATDGTTMAQSVERPVEQPEPETGSQDDEDESCV